MHAEDVSGHACMVRQRELRASFVRAQTSWMNWAHEGIRSARSFLAGRGFSPEFGSGRLEDRHDRRGALPAAGRQRTQHARPVPTDRALRASQPYSDLASQCPRIASQCTNTQLQISTSPRLLYPLPSAALRQSEERNPCCHCPLGCGYQASALRQGQIKARLGKMPSGFLDVQRKGMGIEWPAASFGEKESESMHYLECCSCARKISRMRGFCTSNLQSSVLPTLRRRGHSSAVVLKARNPLMPCSISASSQLVGLLLGLCSVFCLASVCILCQWAYVGTSDHGKRFVI